MGNSRLIHANELHLISPEELKKATVKMVDTLHIAAGSTEGFNIYEVVKAYFTDLEKRQAINEMLGIETPEAVEAMGCKAGLCA